MSQYEFFLASSLEKVFLTRRPAGLEPGSRLSLFRGSRGACQLVCHLDGEFPDAVSQKFEVEITGGPCDATVRRVGQIPVEVPCAYIPESIPDPYYLTREPGLMPDPLEPFPGWITPLPRQYRSLWLSWDIPADAAPGDYPVKVRITPRNPLPAAVGGDFPRALSLTLHVCAAELAPQKLLHTEWFHADCIASHYGVEVFSERHWELLDRFMAAAADHGVNLLLTPVFTPPLDTAVGGERPTTQLVDVTVTADGYSFGFDRLDRWCSLCRRHGIPNLEISHLFTQWGARSAPKIIAAVNGVRKQIFGWDTDAAGAEYGAFLRAFLPALCAHLENLGYEKHQIFFHISDEPRIEQMESYRAARNQVASLLEGYPVIDALSHLEFYEKGLITCPIPGNDAIEPFAAAGLPQQWVYYCISQDHLVPNRFCSMPSARNRIMGVLLYLYHIRGFLHWGFNFYYTQHSVRKIDPFRETDAGGVFPAGDAYLVYPGADGQVLSSLRAEVQDEALLDLRALEALEARIGREAVETLIHEDFPGPMTFTDYPREPEYLLRLREKAAQALEQSEL